MTSVGLFGGHLFPRLLSGTESLMPWNDPFDTKLARRCIVENSKGEVKCAFFRGHCFRFKELLKLARRDSFD